MTSEAYHRSAHDRRFALNSVWVSLSSESYEAHADRFAQTVSKLHRSSYRYGGACHVFLSCDQLWIGDPLTVGGGEKRVDPIALAGLAAIVAPRELVEIAVNVLGADPVVNAEHLPLEVRPCAFQTVDVAEVVADVFADPMVDRVVVEPAFEAAIARELVGHDVGSWFDILDDLPLNGFGVETIHLHCAKLAAALQHAEYGGLADPAGSEMLALPFVLVALFAADERLINLYLARKRLIERLGLGGFAETMRHEPRGLLRDADITSELSAGDPLFVAGDQPNRDEPLAKRQFRILKDRSDFDREALPAVRAFVRPAILEVIDADSAAVGAERAVGPADRPEMPDAGVLVRERAGQIVKGVEVLQHRHLQPTRGIYSLAADGSSSYINPQLKASGQPA